MDRRKELVAQLISLREAESEVRKKLEGLDYEQRFADAKQYCGKYYSEINSHHKKCVRCLFVYGIDKVNCTPESICINYWENQDTFFGIEHYSQLNPKKWDEDEDAWKEITKEEFDHHYSEVMKRVELAINSKNID